MGIPPDLRSPLQEAESKNIKRILETFEVNFCLDMHADEGAIMFPWGIEQNSIAKPGQSATELSAQEEQNFHNPDFDHKRDGNTGTVYREFFPNGPPQRLLDSHKRVAGIMRDAIKSATGRTYRIDNISQVVGTTVGSMIDFIFAQQFLPPKLREIHALVGEFGFDADGHQPDPTKPDGFDKIEREIHAAMISFVRYIAVQHYFVAGSFASTNPGTTGASIGNALTAGGDRCFFTSAVDDLAQRPLSRSHSALARHHDGRHAHQATDAYSRPGLSRIERDRIGPNPKACMGPPSRPRMPAQARGHPGRAHNEECAQWRVRPARSNSSSWSLAAR